jgi:hypothetical protein
MLAPVWVPFSTQNFCYFHVVLLMLQAFIWFSPIESFHVLKIFIFFCINSEVGQIVMAHVDLFSNSSLSALLKRTLTKLNHSPAERVLRPSLFLNVMQRVLVVFPTFRTACGPRLKGSCGPRRAKAATTPRWEGFVLLPTFRLCPASGALC